MPDFDYQNNKPIVFDKAQQSEIADTITPLSGFVSYKRLSDGSRVFI